MSTFNRLNIWLRVLKCYFRTFPGIRCNILDANQTVEAILLGKSLIRFGDGEFGIYSGKDIHYQPCSQELMQEFEKIKQDFESQKESCRYILAMPKKYMQCSGFELGKKRVLVSSWAESRFFFKRNFNLKITYGDSFLFEKKNRDIYNQIWRQSNNRTIIFVHNKPQCASDFAKTYNKRTIHIKCQPHDAFRNWKNTMIEIKMAIEEHNLTAKDCQIVISAGPAGKVLCYYLSKEHYQCIDAGHCWDEPLES